MASMRSPSRCGGRPLRAWQDTQASRLYGGPRPSTSLSRLAPPPSLRPRVNARAHPLSPGIGRENALTLTRCAIHGMRHAAQAQRQG